MKKMLAYVILLMSSTTVNLAQTIEKKEGKSSNSLELSENEKNQKVINKTEFFVEGEDESQLKLNVKVEKDIHLKVTVFNSREKIILAKTLIKKGNHQIYFDSSEGETYKVVLESFSNAEFQIEKTNFIQ